MCRWLAYLGPDLVIDEILFATPHSLIEQSLKARLGSTTNADGFGVGWYGPAGPALYRHTNPAWSDTNLSELCKQISAPLFFAHARASTGTPVQQTNCHPFRHERWLWMHNGAITDFIRIKRDIMVRVDPHLYPAILGTTDSEAMFYLALTFGLKDDPPQAVTRMARCIIELGAVHGITGILDMTLAVSDGSRIWAFRYSNKGKPPTLYRSAGADTMRALHPGSEAIAGVADDATLIVSEPLDDLPGHWVEIPPQSAICVQRGPDIGFPFSPD